MDLGLCKHDIVGLKSLKQTKAPLKYKDFSKVHCTLWPISLPLILDLGPFKIGGQVDLDLFKIKGVICGKEYFDMFFSTLKGIDKHKVKQILELAKT